MFAIYSLHLKAPSMPPRQQECIGCRQKQPNGRASTSSVPIGESEVPMVEDRGVLYVVSVDEIFASTDKGETWDVFCTRPKGDPIGLIIMDEPRVPDMTMYLALRDEGVFRSTDSGTHWRHLNEGLTGERISAVAAVENTLFAGTDQRSSPSRFRGLAEITGRDVKYCLLLGSLRKESLCWNRSRYV